MNIYFVTRWGNEVLDDCGPDGPDTNFLVRAKSHQNAAALADEALLNYPIPWVASFAHPSMESRIPVYIAQVSLG